MKILFICTGNTCRSPMAAALLNKIATDNELDVTAASAGIFAENGAAASKNAILAMKEYDIDLSSHRSKTITDDLVTEADLILTMTEGHKMLTAGMAPDKTYTICEFAGYEGDISDPYGGTLSDYRDSATMIYDCLTEIAEKLVDIYGL